MVSFIINQTEEIFQILLMIHSLNDNILSLAIGVSHHSSYRSNQSLIDAAVNRQWRDIARQCNPMVMKNNNGNEVKAVGVMW